MINSCAWGCSSTGRAFDWQSKGRGFEPPQLHQIYNESDINYWNSHSYICSHLLFYCGHYRAEKTLDLQIHSDIFDYWYYFGYYCNHCYDNWFVEYSAHISWNFRLFGTYSYVSGYNMYLETQIESCGIGSQEIAFIYPRRVFMVGYRIFCRQLYCYVRSILNSLNSMC